MFGGEAIWIDWKTVWFLTLDQRLWVSQTLEEFHLVYLSPLNFAELRNYAKIPGFLASWWSFRLRRSLVFPNQWEREQMTKDPSIYVKNVIDRMYTPSIFSSFAKDSLEMMNSCQNWRYLPSVCMKALLTAIDIQREPYWANAIAS